MTEDEILRHFSYLEKETSRRFTNFCQHSREDRGSLKLLLDENLSPRLAGDLADLFPEAVHVSSVESGSAPDAFI
jgi:hypothetical protein